MLRIYHAYQALNESGRIWLRQMIRFGEEARQEQQIALTTWPRHCELGTVKERRIHGWPHRLRRVSAETSLQTIQLQVFALKWQIVIVGDQSMESDLDLTSVGGARGQKVELASSGEEVERMW
jgi:hypothetical protein